MARTRWGCFGGMRFQPQGSRRAERWAKRSAEAGEPTGAREHVCGPSVILTASVKGAREGARVKIMLVGRPQTAGRASRSGAGLAFRRRQRAIGYYKSAIADSYGASCQARNISATVVSFVSSDSTPSAVRKRSITQATVFSGSDECM